MDEQDPRILKSDEMSRMLGVWINENLKDFDITSQLAILDTTFAEVRSNMLVHTGAANHIVIETLRKNSAKSTENMIRMFLMVKESHLKYHMNKN